MRAAFIETLVEIGSRDRRVVLLTGDLGFMAIEPWVQRFPERFFNVGVAEQNMVGLATGLAEGGYIPFVYSIATFASMRGYEFIRNGPILHRLDVRIVGIGGGFEYGSAGSTHHAIEDIGIMRAQPGIQLIAPADPLQTRSALLKTWNLPGPIYYRIGKDDKAVVSGLKGHFELGRASEVRSGSDLLFVTTGSVAGEVVAAADALDTQGIHSTVLVIASLNPAPVRDLAESLARFARVMTVEAHYVNGGLGSLVAEVIAEHGISCTLVRCGVRTLSDGLAGSQAYLQERHGLSRRALVEAALQLLVQA
jgi:transketolase